MTDIRQQVHYYQAADGSIPLNEWLRTLSDPIGKSRVRARLKLLEFGHVGDWKHIGDGVFELRIHTGPGYRIYFGKGKSGITIALWGGAKGTQSRDVTRARHYWADYLRRTI